MFFSFLFVLEIIFGGLGFVCVEQAMFTTNGGREGESQEEKKGVKGRKSIISLSPVGRGVVGVWIKASEAVVNGPRQDGGTASQECILATKAD